MEQNLYSKLWELFADLESDYISIVQYFNFFYICFVIFCMFCIRCTFSLFCIFFNFSIFVQCCAVLVRALLCIYFSIFFVFLWKVGESVFIGDTGNSCEVRILFAYFFVYIFLHVCILSIFLCIFCTFLHFVHFMCSVGESAFIGATGNSYEVRIGKLSPDKLRHKL